MMKRCKVVGCAHPLVNAYCSKKGICPEHLKADAVRCEGRGDELWRFCQQCGKLESLDCFDGTKRSCRASLHKRRLQSTDKQQKDEGNKRQHQQEASTPCAAVDDYWDHSCSSGGPDCYNDTTAAAATSLAAAWRDIKRQQQQPVAWTQQQLLSDDSWLSSDTWPAVTSAGVCAVTGGVPTAEVAGAVWAATAAGSPNSSGVSAALPAAAAVLPPFNSSPSCSINTCGSGLDGGDEEMLDWMLEMEAELLAAGILATNGSSSAKQQSSWSEAAAPALHEQQPYAAAAAAVTPSHPKPLPAAAAHHAAAAPHYNWGVDDLTASQQLLGSYAAPTMLPTTAGPAQLQGPGQYGTGFSAAAAAVPGDARSSLLIAAGPSKVDRLGAMSTKLQDLTARLQQLQEFIINMQQLRKEGAALRAQVALAAVSAAAALSAAPATCVYTCAGWQ